VIHQANLQSGHTKGMRRAAKARVVGAHHSGNVVQHAFVELGAVDIMFADLVDALPHSQIVVSGGDNQVGPGDGAFRIDLVVVNQRASRSFDHADAFERIDARGRAHLRVDDLRVLQQRFDAFQCKDNLNQAGVVVEERALRDRAETLVEFVEFGVGFRRAAAIRGIQAAKRAHAIDSSGVALV